MSVPDPAELAGSLCAFLDASPSPFHAVATAAAQLSGSGFVEVDEADSTPTAPGRYLLRRGGSLLAWVQPGAGWSRTPDPPATTFRVVTGHTDSPNLRIKPRPDQSVAGWQGLGVEVYGGPLLSSWLDRDLGLSGRAVLRTDRGTAAQHILFHLDDPLLRVSQLAIHLDRDSTREGLKLNPARHLAPHWGLGDEPGDFHGYLADRLGVAPQDLLAWEAMAHDLTPARRIGRDRDLVASARLDNQATCHAAVQALLRSVPGAHDGQGPVPVVVLFDHEEVGSTTASGAQSSLLPTWLERIVLAGGGSRETYARAMAGTVVASADMAHATHPNYPERHDALHPVAMNGGPVLKVNAQARYATDAVGTAAFRLACEQAGVPLQVFVNRTDLPCGSTVGPFTAAATGASTVDVGAATLSMHSAREVCGVADHAAYVAALAAFLAPTA
ncbi:MAG TPA: M18 family aminopeptidase [Ornithinimicrobium sp.]|uniref:M18 family aminopeptidase n=1 Tax=Ornithinimicrobium sp. TaxID=1977084 RepID=UPI002B4A38BB|nr:M18 family aminopeptidase [Ornithinimicrobium sp.]HKJ11781.1 M18 family aminopeptidase [Ornithinimicrobium sp.]